MYKDAGYTVSRPTYNGVPSGNELVINGTKRKFFVGDEGQPNTGFYQWGTSDAGPGGPASTTNGLLNYQDALNYIQSRIGHTLSPQDLQNIVGHFGGDVNTLGSRSYDTGLLDQIVQWMGGGGTGTGPGGTTTTGEPGGGLISTQGQPMLDYIRSMLMDRLASESTPVDPNDPIIQAQMTAARDQLSRQSDTERQQLAEQAYAGSGGADTSDQVRQQIQQSNERSGTALSGLQGQLMMQLYQGKMSRLQDDLKMAESAGEFDVANAIKLQLANLQAELTREGYGVDLSKYEAYINALSQAGLTGSGSSLGF